MNSEYHPLERSWIHLWNDSENLKIGFLLQTFDPPSKTLFSSLVSWFHQTLLGPSYEQHLPECGVMWCQQY